MKRLILIFTLAVLTISVYGQNKHDLKGKITIAGEKTPVEMAAVVIKELNIWTVTDMQGNFTLRGIPAGSYTFVATCLGYENYEKQVTIPWTGESYDFGMNPATLALEEVIVVSKEGRRMGSTSTLQQSAIEHIQPTDLSDVLQLLPGQVAVNPNLSDPKQLSIREISTQGDPTAGLGTLLIVDGARVSNDANMQVVRTSGASMGTLSSAFASTATGGADVRQIAVDNIESVEVVRGIAGAENGDMLSGAVKVNLKKGKTPYIAKVKTDPGIKQVYFGKGLIIPGEIGSLNIDFDYTESLNDLREKYKSYNRINGSIAYSSTLFRNKKPLLLNFKTAFSRSFDVEENDPNQLNYELFESTDQSGTAVLSGKWALNSKLLTNIDFNLSGNIQHQISREVDLESLNGPTPQPVSFVEGEFEAPYLPSTYISNLSIDGRPYYLDGKISASKAAHFGDKVLSNIQGGINFRNYGNNGEGRIYDMAAPPNPTSTSDARTRSYKDIPAMSQLAFYAEENLNVKLGTTSLDIQAGVRYTNLQPDGIFSSGLNTTMLDPRLNIRYTLYEDRSKKFQAFILRFGYGIFSKAGTLLHYYPDKAYYDQVSFNYYEPPNSLLVISTKIIEDTRNYNLKPATNKKYEAGFDIRAFDMELNVTGFIEEVTGGFSFPRAWDNFIFNRYEAVPSGYLPYFIGGEGVFYNDPGTGDPVAVNPVQDTVFVSYSYPANTERTLKKGVEVTLNLGSIPSLRTSFVLDGAYMRITKQVTEPVLEKPTTTYMGKPYPYVGVFPGGQGSIDERISSNIRAITHIKEIRMVFTITAQINWFERSRDIYNDPDGNPLIYTKLPVDDIYDDIEQVKYIDATGYYDLTMQYHDFTASPDLVKPLSDLMDYFGSVRYFYPISYPATWQINLRMTKEITDAVNLSFYANNLTNYRPLQVVNGRVGYFVRRNQPLYFGAELKFKF